MQPGLQLIQRSSYRAANLAVFRRRKAFLLCKNPCGGTAVGMGSPTQSAAAPPAQRNFQRKFALRRVGSSKFVVPPTSSRSKVRNNARQESTQYRAAPGCQRDRSPFCFGKRPEEPLPRGFLWATSSRRLDTALLCAAKKRGVEKGPAGRSLPEPPLVPGPQIRFKKIP